jgi:hypothetical protein
MENTKLIVVDHDFNRTHAAGLIGKEFSPDEMPCYVVFKNKRSLIIKIWAEMDRIFNTQKRVPMNEVKEKYSCPPNLMDKITQAWATTLEDTPPSYLLNS